MDTGRRMKAAVVKETPPGERRVALVPDAVAKLQLAGIDVLVESGAGDGAWLSDAAYADAGASIVSAAEIYRTADVILTVTRPRPTRWASSGRARRSSACWPRWPTRNSPRRWPPGG